MPFKTLLVHAENTPEAEARLTATVELASRWSAHLIGLGGCLSASLRQPFVAEIDGETLQILSDLARDDLAQAKTRFLRTAASLGTRVVWRSREGYPDQVAENCALGADLVIADCRCGSSPTTIAAGVIALHAGVPVLALPTPPASLAMKRVVVAWKNAREARRAVTDALPLLQRASSVHLVEIAPNPDEADAWDGLAGVRERLSAHGVVASFERVRRRESYDAADELIARARSWGADLLVAGAYGHSRLREWTFGGVTRGLLQRSPLPVLFSH